MLVKESIRKLTVSLICLMMTLSGLANLTSVSYAGSQPYITDVKVGSYGKLADEGYSVMSTSLTMSGKKMYLGYKAGSGSPVTGLLYGSSKSDSISYKSAGGDLYFTRDKKAGNPVVGIDILRPDTESGKNPPAIANDGSVIVRNKDGEPADFQKGEKTVYLAEIHDGSIMPYIKEVVSVTGSDKTDAVYKAATYGYDYYVDGDVDGSKKSYTILAYDRTPDPEEAVTNVTAISADLLKNLIKAQNGLEDEQESQPEEAEPDSEEAEPEQEESEPEAEAEQEEEDVIPEDESSEDDYSEVEQADSEDEQEQSTEDEGEQADENDEQADDQPEDVPEDAEPEPEPEPEVEVPQESADSSVSVDAELALNGDALDLSGIEYNRMSSKVIDGKRPYYIYATKDKNAGNPITMLYVGGEKGTSETTLGIWARGYFTTKGVSNAYSYIINEDSLSKLEHSTDVYIRKPVALFEDQGEEEFDIKARLSKISVLTAKAGLPDDELVLNGLIEPSYDAPDIVENERDNPDSDLPASAFSAGNVITLAIGLIVLAIVFRHMTKGQKNGEKKEK